MSTKRISAHTIIRLWVSLVLFYLVRSWAQTRKLTLAKEILLHMVVFISAYVIETFIWPTRVEMGREESDLVQEYLRYRKEGETIGQYLIRLEKEEEESIRLHEEMLFKRGNRQSKKQRRHG